METSEKYLTIKQVADRLSVSPSTVRNLIKQQRLSAVRLTEGGAFRIAESAYQQYIQAHTTAPASSANMEVTHS